MTKIKLFVGAIAVVALSAAAFSYVRSQNEATGTEQASSHPVFHFDESQAPGWRSIGNTNPQSTVDTETYDEENFGSISQLPVANILVHHGGPDDEPLPDRCFVSLSYYDFPIESAADAHDKDEQEATKWGGSVELIDTRQKTIETFDGEKTYELRSYDSKVGTPGEFMSGIQAGFVTFDNSHIEVRGTCQTAEDSPLTLPIMDAISLHAS